MKPYSKDLRLRVLAACDRGMPRKGIVRLFGASAPTIRRYLRLRRETGGVQPRPAPGPSARKGAALEAALPAQARANPDLTLEELAVLFEEESGVRVSTATMSRAFARLGLSLKKSPSPPPSATRRRGRAGGGGCQINPERLVFVDECGTRTSTTRLGAGAPKGERAYGKVPRNRGKNTTLLASMGAQGTGPCLAVEGASTRPVFEAYVERALLPSLRPGQVAVLENLPAHKGDRVRELVEGRGCEPLFLPPYSQEFSSVEEAFSKLKARLRKAAARARGSLLVEAIGRALDAVTARDARGWFGHCGYPLGAQPS